MSFVVRIYTNDDSFHSLFDLPVLNPIPDWVRQFQVVLTFARDYNENGISTNGRFIPYWNRNIVTPAAIAQLKERDPKIKVLVSIGDRDPRYPFEIGAGIETPLWIANAVQSLTTIIQTYHLDGIDVYYEHIIGGDFVDAIGNLIVELRKNGAANLASIAPSAPVNVDFYSPLYQQYGNYIDNVVYQSYNEPQPIATIQDFLTLYAALVNAPNSYPSGKLLAGYSNHSPDWSKVSPPLYFIGFFSLLVTGGIVNGPSIWTISVPCKTFPPQWIIEIITLFLALPEENRNQLGLVFRANN